MNSIGRLAAAYVVGHIIVSLARNEAEQEARKPVTGRA